jgi:hypothetical protein
VERLTGSKKRVLTMLAEIFMVRLEATPRPSQELLPSSTSQFVPFNKEGQFVVKDRNDRLVEATTPQEARSGKPMLKLAPAIKYTIDALLILIPLFGMTYFLFDPTAFNAFLAWLMQIL